MEIAAKGFFAVPDEDARPLAARLREFRERLGLTQEALAEAIDLPITTYQRYERGGSEPKTDTIRALAELGCDPTWLVTGHSRAQHQIQAMSDRPAATFSVPFYGAGFSAGAGKTAPETPSKRWIELPEQWVRRMSGRNPDNLIMASAEGDSMAPTIADGDDLLIDITDKRLANGKIYALSVDGQMIVKRVARPVHGRYILLISDNEAYPPEELGRDAQDTLNIIGQVVWSGGGMG